MVVFEFPLPPPPFFFQRSETPLPSRTTTNVIDGPGLSVQCTLAKEGELQILKSPPVKVSS